VFSEQLAASVLAVRHGSSGRRCVRDRAPTVPAGLSAKDASRRRSPFDGLPRRYPNQRIVRAAYADTGTILLPEEY